MLIQTHLPEDHDALFLSSMFDEVGREKIFKGRIENVKQNELPIRRGILKTNRHVSDNAL